MCSQSRACRAGSREKVKVAFIGAGNIAAQHMRALVAFPDVAVEGVCDVSKSVLEQRRLEFGVGTYSSVGAMLRSVSPDAVFICLPPYAHGGAERACISRGIPFLVEKPLSNDLFLARKIAAEVRRTGLLTSVAYMNRYRRSVQRAKELLGKHPPVLIDAGWRIGTPLGHPWLTQKRLSGGQLLEQTTHLFDLIRYLCGEAASVYCCGARGFVPRSRAYDTDDATVVSLCMRNGAVASIQSSWSSGLCDMIHIRFLGPAIMVELTGWNQDARIVTKRSSVEISGEEDIFAIEDRAFLHAVRSGDSSGVLSDYGEGVRSLELSIAANMSLETGKPIKLRGDGK